MARRVTIPVRSFGSEVGEPTVEDLAEWVAERRGQAADLVTYNLDRSLCYQTGVDIPAAGGMFYGDRWREAFVGLHDGILTDEPDIEQSEVVADARYATTIRKEVWFALPAPHLLGIEDAYFNDDEEFRELLATQYARLAREMRDAGVKGHVLIADKADEIELEVLADRKITFYPRRWEGFDIETLLEYQGDCIIPAEHLPDAPDLFEKYRIRRLILVNPKSGDLAEATEHVDSDLLLAGGYCEENCRDYWESLVAQSFILR
jgi:hypothetical protein